ncbi:MAG: hypothetical protein EOP21_01125 [Hyphomicrobiales bacterium]|nr:MAG: hypothetical protein EOP21_01125 [Hyphomicrobiales bacterium]
MQKTDGSFTQTWADFGSNFFKTGDFDGDGRTEVANFVDVWGPNGPTSYGIRFTEINADGTVGETKLLTTQYERVEMGLNWTGAMWPITVSKDQNGNEFADHGIHFGQPETLPETGRMTSSACTWLITSTTIRMAF